METKLELVARTSLLESLSIQTLGQQLENYTLISEALSRRRTKLYGLVGSQT